MLEYDFVTRAADLGRIAEEIVRADVLGFDIETTALEPREGDIRLVQLSLPGEENSGYGKIYVIDLFETKGLGPILPAMRDSKAIWVVHNAKFEQKWFWWKHRFKFWPVFCTYRASALLYNGVNGASHDLDSVIVREMNEHPENTGQGGSDWSGALTQKQKDYAAEDVLRLLKLRKVLKQKLSDYGLLKTALIEFGVILPEGRTELNGFPLSRDKWTSLAEANREERKRLKEELLYELPHPRDQVALPGLNGSWNVDSPQQVLTSLRKLGLKIDNTSEMTLASVAKKAPVIQKLLKYRHVSQRVKTFGEPYLRWINPSTGRIHTSYFGMLASGRYSSSSPNIQQIPRSDDFRACFTAPDGRCFILADYAGIEMRIVAEISEDPVLIDVFATGKDAHRTTASVIMAKPPDKITKPERQNAKPVNFGFIYGMMPDKFVMYAQANYGIAISKSEAEKYHARYFQQYAGVKRWHQRVLRDGQRMGLSRTLSGRLRYLDPNKAFNEFYNCLDAETEALTARGWVRGMDLTTKDLVLTKNAETGLLEWQHPTDVKKWPDYQGPLVEFRSRSFNSVSTPNHRWLVNDKAGNTLVRTTDELSPHGDHRIHRTGIPSGAEVGDFSDYEVYLIGMLVTDGMITRVTSRGGRPKVVLSQSLRAKPWNVNKIQEALNKARWGHSRHMNRETFVVTWHLQKVESERLAALFPGKLLTGGFLTRLTKPQIGILYRAMVAGDGHVDRSGKVTFYAGTREVADSFAMVAAMWGKATTTHARDMSKYEPKSAYLSNVPKMGTSWHVNVLSRNTAQVTADQRRRFEGHQPIWCPIVPNTFFVARREGQVFVTGNTPIQGTGADALKASMGLVQERLDKRFGVTPPEQPDGPVFIAHHVHDEIILEAPDEQEIRDEAQKQLHDGMHEGMAQFLRKVPVLVEPAHGPTWAEAK